MDMEFACLSQHAEGGNESHESETVVAMEVGDEDVVEAFELESQATKLDLRTLSAVNHEEFLTDIDHL